MARNKPSKIEFMVPEKDTGFSTVPPSMSTMTFGSTGKSKMSIGGYTSFFARKLLPPLGFYRPLKKYANLKLKFAGDPDKLNAVNEMWHDYQKYQIIKRFRWPPYIFFEKFVWTTGYYKDYYDERHATRLQEPGEDSSEDEFIDPTRQFMVVGDDGDIDLEELERYHEAKRAQKIQAKAKAADMADLEGSANRRGSQSKGGTGGGGTGLRTETTGAQGESLGAERGTGARRESGGKGGASGQGREKDESRYLADSRPTVIRLFGNRDANTKKEGATGKGAVTEKAKPPLLKRSGASLLYLSSELLKNPL